MHGFRNPSSSFCRLRRCGEQQANASQNPRPATLAELAVRSVNGSTWRAYRRLAERFGAWAEARSLEPLAALADQDVVAAYLVHVAATDGRLTMLQHAVSALRHVARHAGATRRLSNGR